MSQISKENFSLPEAAAWLGISRGTLFNLWRRSLGPERIKLGKRVIINRSALQSWLANLQKEQNKKEDGI